MYNKSLRFISILLVLIITILQFAGCSGRKAEDDISSISLITKDSNFNMTGFPIVKEKINLTGVGSRGPNQDDWNKLLVFEEYEKMTNITFTWQTFPQDSFDAGRDKLIASGDLPDLFLRASLNLVDELKYGNDGTIIPLNDLIKKYAPAFMSIAAKDPDVIRNITKSDGKIYALPQLREALESRTTKSWINKKWLNKLELKVPTTTDELYSVLKAFKDSDPNNNGQQDEIPFSGYLESYSNSFFSFFLGYWGYGNTTGMLNYFIDVDKDGKIRFIAEDSRYREVLMYLNRLWSEDLIDKDFFYKNPTMFSFNLKDNQIGYLTGGVDNSWLGKYKDDFVCLPVLKGPYGDQIHNVVAPFVQSIGTFAITKKNKYPEATMRWIDYLYTKEGTTLFRMGIEGKTYKKLPDGTLEYLEDITKNRSGLRWDQAIAKYTIGAGGGIPQLITVDTDKQIIPENHVFTKPIIPYISKEMIIPQYSPDQISMLNGELSELYNYTRQMTYKFIIGEESFTNWDKYTAKLKELGSEEYKQLFEDIYRRYKGAN